MEKQDLYELMDRFERSSLQRMKLRRGDFSLELCRGTAPAPAAPAPREDLDPGFLVDPADQFVRAPLLGTFYAAPAPGEAPFVRPGDRVEKGRTVCLIEAMKTMNEIPAPCDLIVQEVCFEDGALVEYEAPLLRYRHV